MQEKSNIFDPTIRLPIAEHMDAGIVIVDLGSKSVFMAAETAALTV